MKAKQWLCLCVAFLLVCLLAGCGEGDAKPSDGTAAVDVDLTALSSTMVYSEVYNMVNTPVDYLGKTVKATGKFAVYHDDASGKNYYACLISDATACCSQGLEFVLDGDYTYPTDYPALGTEITVVGTFDTYQEGSNLYCQLIHAAWA